MRKRASLATTMVYEPDIILMDEPFSALDVQTRNLMENELLEIWAQETFTADSLATREVVMSVLRTFEAVGQIPNDTKMDPEGLIDTRFVKKALERK
jgi:ABC-type taurine transport system ATPase subunit